MQQGKHCLINDIIPVIYRNGVLCSVNIGINIPSLIPQNAMFRLTDQVW